MNQWIKRAGLGIALLLILGVAALLFGSMLGEQKRQRMVDIAVQPVAWATDAEGIALGRYLFRSRGCADCHGSAGEGREFINDGKGMRIIRHGVKADGHAAFIMTSEDYNRFSQGSAMVRYPDAETFVAMLSVGKRPDGSAIKVMPFESLRELNDIDALALYAFLKTVPARSAGQH